jgi:hypothetical protein
MYLGGVNTLHLDNVQIRFDTIVIVVAGQDLLFETSLIVWRPETACKAKERNGVLVSSRLVLGMEDFVMPTLVKGSFFVTILRVPLFFITPLTPWLKRAKKTKERIAF